MISSFLRKKIPALPAKQKKQRGRPRKTKAAPAQEGRWGCLRPALTRQSSAAGREKRKRLRLKKEDGGVSVRPSLAKEPRILILSRQQLSSSLPLLRDLLPSQNEHAVFPFASEGDGRRHNQPVPLTKKKRPAKAGKAQQLSSSLPFLRDLLPSQNEHAVFPFASEGDGRRHNQPVPLTKKKRPAKAGKAKAGVISVHKKCIYAQDLKNWIQPSAEKSQFGFLRKGRVFAVDKRRF